MQKTDFTGRLNRISSFYSENGAPSDLAEDRSYRDLVNDCLIYAEQGVANAQQALAVCYAHGYGVRKNHEEALKWLNKALEQNDARAQCELGMWYDNGTVVRNDQTEAIRWYRKSAEGDYGKAAYLLGAYYQKRFPANHKQAIYWYKKAVDEGYHPAVFNLGSSLLRAGKYVDAFNQFKIGATAGSSECRLALAECYAYGEGTKKSMTKAFINAARAFSDVEFARKQIYERMTPLLDAIVLMDRISSANTTRVTVVSRRRTPGLN